MPMLRMNYEANRLNSFTDWPVSLGVEPGRLAKAGFYYAGHCWEVECFVCRCRNSEWSYGVDCMALHRSLNPCCSFVLDPSGTGNVPLSNEGRSNLTNEYGLTENDVMYRSDALRLLSFVNWTDESVSRESLVNAGFYHAGEGRLRCAWCGGELTPMRNMGSLGEPLNIHRSYFPNCEHAAMLAARDAMILTEELPSRTRHPSPPRIPREQTEPTAPLIQSEGAAHNANVLLSQVGTWRSLGVVAGAAGAKYPRYASLASRLATYTEWPADRTQRPETLAEAGFFYTGSDDKVHCFYCDGGLGQWEAGDVPWREHARWFPHCGFLMLTKGRDYVEQHQNVVPTSLPYSTRASCPPQNSNPVTFEFTDAQVAEQMQGAPVIAALGAGLDVARVRRAICRRLRNTGIPFTSAEALIDAVLDGQLNEEAWSASPQRQIYARDILNDLLPSNWEDRSDSRHSGSSRSLSPDVPRCHQTRPSVNTMLHSVNSALQSQNPTPPSNMPVILNIPEEKAVTQSVAEIKPDDGESSCSGRSISLEEEVRQLKEARLCKVCMDNEICVVFLPCGHLVSCAGCATGLSACPLCRSPVKALVRAYLA